MMLHDLLRSSAQRCPQRIAVIARGRAHTYEELDLLAERGAHALAARGVRPGDRVALLVDKSAAGLAVMQSVLRIGATYVPLDIMSPPARIHALLEACRVKAFVSDARHTPRVLSHAQLQIPVLDVDAAVQHAIPEHGLVAAEDPSRLAYILFTSGSTGTPKGVCVSHRSALACIQPMAAAIGAVEHDRFANHAGWHFDISLLDIYIAFLSGGSVVHIADEISFSPDALAQCIAEHRITIWYSVPSVLTLMLRHGALTSERAASLRVCMFGGDFFPLDQLRKLRAVTPSARLLNVYGPTETNLCSFYEVTEIPSDRVAPMPIGNGCCGNRLTAVRDDGELARAGDIGDLVVEGPTVMTGYWGEPPLENARYRTGDLVRVLGDGFEMLGRSDWMVKVRGYRVDLGEIDSVLQSHPDVVDAATVVVGAGLDARLVAWIVARNALSTKDLRKHCASRLPRYMVVDEFRWRDALPYSRNGKVNRKALVKT